MKFWAEIDWGKLKDWSAHFSRLVHSYSKYLMGFNSDIINSEARGHIRFEDYSKCLPGYLSRFIFSLSLCLTKERYKPLVGLSLYAYFVSTKTTFTYLPWTPLKVSPVSVPIFFNGWTTYSMFLTQRLILQTVNLLSYLLAPWSRVLLEKLTGFHIVEKFPAFCGTRRFITAVTSAGHLLFDCFATWYFFYYEELLAPRPTPKLEDHPLSAIRDFLFNIFAGTLHIRGLSSMRNLRTRHAVVTGTHLSQPSDGMQSQITSLPCESLYRQLMLVGMIFYAYLTPHYRATKKCFCQWHSGKIDCLLNMVSYRRV
jgi:hypothetical protein